MAQQVKKQPDLEKLAHAYRCTQGEVAKYQQKVDELAQLQKFLQASSISTHAPVNNQGANGNGKSQHQATAPQNQNQNQNYNQTTVAKSILLAGRGIPYK